jgi:hypothetical protein
MKSFLALLLSFSLVSPAFTEQMGDKLKYDGGSITDLKSGPKSGSLPIRTPLGSSETRLR